MQDRLYCQICGPGFLGRIEQTDEMSNSVQPNCSAVLLIWLAPIIPLAGIIVHVFLMGHNPNVRPSIVEGLVVDVIALPFITSLKAKDSPVHKFIRPPPVLELDVSTGVICSRVRTPYREPLELRQVVEIAIIDQSILTLCQGDSFHVYLLVTAPLHLKPSRSLSKQRPWAGTTVYPRPHFWQP